MSGFSYSPFFCPPVLHTPPHTHPHVLFICTAPQAMFRRCLKRQGRGSQPCQLLGHTESHFHQGGRLMSAKQASFGSPAASWCRMCPFNHSLVPLFALSFCFHFSSVLMAFSKRILLCKALWVSKLHPCRSRAKDMNWQPAGWGGSLQIHTPVPQPHEGLGPGHWTRWTPAFLLIKMLQWCHTLFWGFRWPHPLDLLLCWSVSDLQKSVKH